MITMPVNKNENIPAGPACLAIIPGIAKIPAPMVAPIPSAVSISQPRCLGVSTIKLGSWIAGVLRSKVVSIGVFLLIKPFRFSINLTKIQTYVF